MNTISKASSEYKALLRGCRRVERLLIRFVPPAVHMLEKTDELPRMWQPRLPLLRFSPFNAFEDYPDVPSFPDDRAHQGREPVIEGETRASHPSPHVFGASVMGDMFEYSENTTSSDTVAEAGHRDRVGVDSRARSVTETTMTRENKEVERGVDTPSRSGRIPATSAAAFSPEDTEPLFSKEIDWGALGDTIAVIDLLCDDLLRDDEVRKTDGFGDRTRQETGPASPLSGAPKTEDANRLGKSARSTASRLTETATRESTAYRDTVHGSVRSSPRRKTFVDERHSEKALTMRHIERLTREILGQSGKNDDALSTRTNEVPGSRAHRTIDGNMNTPPPSSKRGIGENPKSAGWESLKKKRLHASPDGRGDFLSDEMLPTFGNTAVMRRSNAVEAVSASAPVHGGVGVEEIVPPMMGEGDVTSPRMAETAEGQSPEDAAQPRSSAVFPPDEAAVLRVLEAMRLSSIEEVARALNDVLVGQARRHGVDLT